MDSTRAGKRLPDALAKTVPIWCAVVNRALRLRSAVSDGADTASDSAEAQTPWLEDGDLHTPPGVVGAHEHAQIATRLDGWAAGLAVRVAAPERERAQKTVTDTFSRTRRTRSRCWIGRCALCGSHPRPGVSRTSRLTRRSCRSYA